MAKKSKLLAALDAHQGRDFAAEKRKAQVKAADKRKRQKIEKTQKVGGDDAEDQTTAVNGAATQDDFTAFSDAEEDEDDATAAADKSTTTTNNKTIPQPTQPADASASEAEDDSDVPLSELSEEDLEDTIPHQRLTINNGPALIASTNRIALLKHPAKTPFHVHNSLTSTLPPATDSIPDPNDDLTRELEFYRIARAGALEARTLLRKEKIPFTRPSDYFAEMVKSDEHMGRIKKKMYDEAAGKKASEEARKLRDAKKFGKAVQVAKEQERAKEKRGTLDKIKELKRKRKGQDAGTVTEDDKDLFQSIDVENAPTTKDRGGRDRGDGANTKRQKRDQKYGHGGKKRFAKSGDAVSSGDMRGFSASKMKGKSQRPGKARRANAK